MIVQSDFLGHWKVLALANQVGELAAVTALLSLWAHCEKRRAWEFELTPLMLAGMCKFTGDAQVLYDTMLALKLLDRCEQDPQWVQVHEWGKVNGALVCKWVGHKGKGWFWHPRGHACKSLEESIDPPLELSLGSAIVPAIGLDRIGLDRIGLDRIGIPDLAGKPPGEPAGGGISSAGSSSNPAKTDSSSTAAAPEGPDLAKKKKGDGAAAKPRPRNELFDELVRMTGTPLNQVTKALGGAVAAALRDIKEVSPEVTAVDIQRRAAAYREKWPKMTLSPSALAKHWGSLGPAKKEGGAAGVPEADLCPAGYEAACAALYGGVIEPWAMLGVGQQAEVRAWLETNRGEGFECPVPCDWREVWGEFFGLGEGPPETWQQVSANDRRMLVGYIEDKKQLGGRSR